MIGDDCNYSELGTSSTYAFTMLSVLAELMLFFNVQLEEVMEKETYKAAKDLLDKYDPNSEILKV